MKCPNCNTENDSEALNCINCGEPLSTESIEAEAPDDRSTKLEEIKARRLRKKQKQKRNKIILICIIAAAVIAGASFGIYWVRSSVLDRTTTDNTPETLTQPPTETPSEVITETPAAESESPVPTVEAVTEAPTEIPGWQTAAPAATPAAAPSGNTSAAVPATKAPAKTQKPAAAKTPKPAAQSSTKTTTKPVTSSPGFTAGSVAVSEVPQGQPMVSQLIKADGYRTVPTSGQQILSFSIGNSTYFAYPPAGGLSGNGTGYYSVDAAATGDVFYGLPVYRLTNVVAYAAEDYIIPKSASVLLTEDDLKGLTKSQLTLARNEIFARHGRTFKKQELQKFFESKSWYKVNPSYNYSNDYLNLSSIEKANAKFILAYENK